jgi:diguanylate cyclase (GGDEF)-like protein
MPDKDPAPAPGSHAAREICCSMTSVLLALVRDQRGDDAVTRLLARAGCQHDAYYLNNVDNWISLDEACALLEAGVQETGDALFARRVGERTVPHQAGTQVSAMLRSLGSPEAVLQAIVQSSAKFSTVTEMDAVEVGPGRVVVSARARPGFQRRPLHCDWATGLIAGTPMLFGLPPAEVTESECQARGGRQCLYTVSWDAELAAAAADPQQRITALEIQLAAASERLQSVYETASDLVSIEDLDTALHRIVERAANAVRAPSYVLAVRPDDRAELQVYSHGIDAAEAQALALAASDGGVPRAGSTLVADVTSSRRHYGRLIARNPSADAFFPQEGELLGLYAKHAAAVLDIATALEEASERNAEVSSLLSLAHAVAQAGTSQEVGQRLADAVPQVVDCDRIGVWRWDAAERCIKFLAASGHTAEQEARLREFRVGPADTPRLGEMIADQQPLFFEADTEDHFIAQMMVVFEMAALVVVPIVAHDVFLGMFTVVAGDRPQRLRPDGELLAQLTGVAALAAPAIQNGMLVDELGHKASHDALTGLLNRTGFRQRINRALTRVELKQGHFAVLFVDLDDFKQVNDIYGHEVGDQLLRQAAARLIALGRDSDEVARLGGDEFAVILSDISRDDQVRAAEGRAREAFVEPFLLDGVSIAIGASVGGAIWPHDGGTIKELIRYADAAMYRDKAEGRRSPADVSAIGAYY